MLDSANAQTRRENFTDDPRPTFFRTLQKLWTSRNLQTPFRSNRIWHRQYVCTYATRDFFPFSMFNSLKPISRSTTLIHSYLESFSFSHGVFFLSQLLILTFIFNLSRSLTIISHRFYTKRENNKKDISLRIKRGCNNRTERQKTSRYVSLVINNPILNWNAIITSLKEIKF